MPGQSSPLPKLLSAGKTVRATMDVFLQALSWTVGYTTIRVSGQYRHAFSLH